MDNRHNIIRIIVILIGILTGVVSVFANGPDIPKTERPFQISFIYPMGTNGIGSPDISNKVSINIFGGVNGGVNGFEAGGFVNVITGDVRGAQYSGMINYVHGSTSGAQFAGFSNISMNHFSGAGFAGFSHVIIGDTKGAVFAGLANIGLGDIDGAQFAGLVNAGISEVKTTQIAGIANLAVKRSTGLQLAGIANVSAEGHKGAQIAGIANFTPKLNGFQMALINLADTVEKGTPFGFISLVRKGYHAVELETNELFYANLTFKTGVKHLYNIFSIGYRPDNEKQNWGFTYGLGTYTDLNENLSMNFDATATHINEGSSWTDTLNMVNRLKLNIGYKPGKHFQLFGGISMNVAVSKLRNEEGRITGSTLLPSYDFYNSVIGNTYVKIYPGFNVGIRF